MKSTTSTSSPRQVKPRQPEWSSEFAASTKAIDSGSMSAEKPASGESSVTGRCPPLRGSSGNETDPRPTRSNPTSTIATRQTCAHRCQASPCARLAKSPVALELWEREFSTGVTHGGADRIDGACRALGRWIAPGWTEGSLVLREGADDLESPNQGRCKFAPSACRGLQIASERVTDDGQIALAASTPFTGHPPRALPARG